MPTPSAVRKSSDATDAITDAICNSDSPIVLAKAPPGAGKTTTMRIVTRRLLDSGAPVVPIVVQTNAQADDLMIDLANEGIATGRFVSETAQPASDAAAAATPNLTVSRNLPGLGGCQVIVAPADKWLFTTGPRVVPPHYDIALIDEAYQMRADKLYLTASLFDRAVAVGDPGQLDPFTVADPRRFEGLARGPLDTAAGTLESSYPEAPIIELPVSWRLPASAVPLVRDAFYELDFESATEQDERALHCRAGNNSAVDAAIDEMVASGWGYLELPERYTLRTDAEIVSALVGSATRLLERQTYTHCERHGHRRLAGNRIAIGTAHRDQASVVRAELTARATATGDASLTEIIVDTANRLQGREFDVTLVWHPLAGRRDATTFHLESGRLCVLLSRHRQGCIVVGRAGTEDLLDAHPTESRLFLNLPADCPDGWEANQAVLEHLKLHRVVANTDTSLGSRTE